MKATIQYIGQELRELYPQGEVKAFTRLILEKVCGLSFTQQLLLRDDILDQAQTAKIKIIVERLKNYEPIQYVLGETEFLGMPLQVNRSVLIPRPETEELVQWITESAIPPGSAFLDIGTGSGCIALGIKKLIPDAVVHAAEISADALQVARANAATNHLEVDFVEADILLWEKYSWGKYGIIVSNPPYVRESETAVMEANVLKYEPETALFVPDADPLKFYRHIANFAFHNLNNGGWLFFEINESLGKEMKTLVREYGFSSIEIRHDLSGKVRMLRCCKE